MNTAGQAVVGPSPFELVDVGPGGLALGIVASDRWPASTLSVISRAPDGEWQVRSLVVDPDSAYFYHLVGLKVRGLAYSRGWVSWDTLATREFWCGLGAVLRGGDQVEMTLRRSCSARAVDFRAALVVTDLR